MQEETASWVWTYSMRREMQEVIPNLYLGPYSSATKSKLQSLLDAGITHIICVRQDVEARLIRPMFTGIIKYLVLNISDTVTENIIQHFPVVVRYLEECFQSGGKALVHGNAGISRSAALVLAYVMQKYDSNYKEAFWLVQSKRFCISPNEGFVRQLEEYEPIYKAQKTFQNTLSCHNVLRRKRSIDDDPSRMDSL